MNDADFNAGAITAFLIMLFFVIFVWHMAESECQREHNIADCEWNFEVVPRIQEKQEARDG